MKQILSLLWTLCVTVLPIGAEVINMDVALLVAQNFISNLDNGATVNHMMTVNSAAHPSRPLYYIYNSSSLTGHGRYIIVAGDSRARQVLAYGDGPIDVNDIPDGLQEMMDIYAEQIESLVGNGDSGHVVRLAAGRPDTETPNTIEPLLSTMWGQNSPFNQATPIVDGQACTTGCAATALSMILAHHCYANLVDSLPRYVTKTLGITIGALEPIDFDWDNMIDDYSNGNYTADQARAVAQLMRYVGQAELMDYTTGASGANIYSINNAIGCFGYSHKLLINNQDNDATWGEMIQSQLQSGCPVLYCARSQPASSHAFVIDGYDSSSDTYHINWGWSGKGNGHCALNAFKPSNSSTVYNEGHMMIVDIHPAAKTVTVDKDSLSFEEFTGYTQTQTLTVTGYNLSQDVNLEVVDMDGCSMFEVSPSVITPAQAAKGQTVTVQFTPCSQGVTQAVVLLTSSEIDTVAVELMGQSVIATGYIQVDSTTIHITGTVNTGDSLHIIDVMGDGTNCVIIPIKVYHILSQNRMCAGYGNGNNDADPHDVIPSNVCSYNLEGDGSYQVGFEQRDYMDPTWVTLETPLTCRIPILYDFRTTGQHNATLTITSRTMVTRPVVIHLIGEAVCDGDYVCGDVNGDGTVNVSDVTKLISHVLGNDVVADVRAADMNSDGSINVSDVTSLINRVLNNS